MYSMEELLARDVYSMAQVDELLGLTAGTARRWIDGYERGGRHYEPVSRETTTEREIATWGELVETRLLASYRDKGVSMLHMRPAVERLRQEFQLKYPLAHVKPYVSGRELVYAVQDEVGLDPALRFVVARSNQYILTPPSQDFFDHVESENDVVVRLRPLGQRSPVMVDPLRQFGAPVVRSVPTEVIAEQFRAGDEEEMIAELYELDLKDVRAAIRYELTVRSAA
jgi:uncharacterized protein (DUF433 family)/transposase